MITSPSTSPASPPIPHPKHFHILSPTRPSIHPSILSRIYIRLGRMGSNVLVGVPPSRRVSEELHSQGGKGQSKGRAPTQAARVISPRRPTKAVGKPTATPAGRRTNRRKRTTPRATCRVPDGREAALTSLRLRSWGRRVCRPAQTLSGGPVCKKNTSSIPSTRPTAPGDTVRLADNTTARWPAVRCSVSRAIPVRAAAGESRFGEAAAYSPAHIRGIRHGRMTSARSLAW